MKWHRLYLVLLYIIGCFTAFAQDPHYRYSLGFDDTPRGDDRFRIAFYNVENLFDPFNDSLTNDDEFTPEGGNRYTFDRYKKKTKNLAKTMISIGGWEPVEIIGLCEVENEWVLKGLTVFSPLRNANYQIIHQDSPDWRGIDVAAIYRPDKFHLNYYEYIPVRFPESPEKRTRDILYIQGTLPNQDTLHLFINHWPSRYGGQFVTAPMREHVGRILRKRVDELYEKFDQPLVVLMGDFNDEPDDISLTEGLGAKPTAEEAAPDGLVNLMYSIKYKFGSHSFAGEWGVLDQFIVSYPLINGAQATRVATESGMIFDAPWLLKSNAAGNSVTNRTYQGPAYKGGYSDHLPIYLDLKLQEKSPGTNTGATN